MEMPNIETSDRIINCSCHFALPTSANQHTPLGLGYLGNQAMMRRVNRAPLAPTLFTFRIRFSILDSAKVGSKSKLCKTFAYFVDLPE